MSNTIDSTKWNGNWDYHFNKNYELTEIECFHDKCPECEGTGRKKSDGSTCIHMISCPCPKCTLIVNKLKGMRNA